MQNLFQDIPGAILSFDVVCAASVIMSIIIKVNKQVEEKIRNCWTRDQRKSSEKQGNS